MIVASFSFKDLRGHDELAEVDALVHDFEGVKKSSVEVGHLDGSVSNTHTLNIEVCAKTVITS